MLEKSIKMKLAIDGWMMIFLKYDYIGAPWKKNLHFLADGTNVRVGNGGFSLRSKKILNAPSDLNLPFTDNGTGLFHEDGVLCVYHRKILEENGIKYAPVEIASMFSKERWCPDSKFFTFGFHSNRRNIFKYLWKKLEKLIKIIINKNNRIKGKNEKRFIFTI
jgi:hypothetical protein